MSPYAHPALRDAPVACVPWIVRPCTSHGIGAIHRADPSGIAASDARHADGDPEIKNGAHRARRNKSKTSQIGALVLGAQERAAFDSRGPIHIAAAADDQAPSGVGAGRADFAGYTDVPSAKPGRCRGPGAQDARRAQCAGGEPGFRAMR